MSSDAHSAKRKAHRLRRRNRLSAAHVFGRPHADVPGFGLPLPGVAIAFQRRMSSDTGDFNLLGALDFRARFCRPCGGRCQSTLLSYECWRQALQDQRFARVASLCLKMECREHRPNRPVSKTPRSAAVFRRTALTEAVPPSTVCRSVTGARYRNAPHREWLRSRNVCARRERLLPFRHPVASIPPYGVLADVDLFAHAQERP